LRKAVVLLALDALKSTLVVLSYYRNKEEWGGRNEREENMLKRKDNQRAFPLYKLQYYIFKSRVLSWGLVEAS
jgi:hypothetical protein